MDEQGADPWVLFSERRPPENTNVLLSDGRDIVTAYYTRPSWCERSPYWGRDYHFAACGIGGYEWEFEFDVYANGTHWMAAPELPK